MQKETIFIISVLCSLLIPNIVAETGLFPRNFTWGVASASYQIEGAWNVSGKGLSIWDTFASTPGRIAKNQTGQVADDFYHLYPGDIALMKSFGIKNYRMSISWPRILPKGTVDQPNPEGVKFYNDLFEALLMAGIEPWVGLYHWDLPQALDDKSDKGGWLNPDLPNIFNAYADFCFQNFGDKVKNWLTFNEINTFSWIGYGSGVHAPGRCSPERGSWCKEVGGGGNSSTEPYIVTHHALIAHALAVNTYRTKYKKTQGGQIGMTMGSSHFLPYDPNSPDDVKAVDISLAFSLGWFADPQVFGHYPEEMRNLVTGNRLPEFNETMSALLKGSYDFLGINHYTSSFVHYTGIVGDAWDNDHRNTASPYDVNGDLIGPFAESSWINVYPPGLRGLLNWASKRYNHPPLYVFENGVSCPNESSLPIEQALNDTFRLDYLKGYIGNLALTLIEDSVDVRGYFLWSLMDNFEWADGLDVRFGVVYIDYNDGLKRLPKRSMQWYSNLINILSKNETKEIGGLRVPRSRFSFDNFLVL